MKVNMKNKNTDEKKSPMFLQDMLRGGDELASELNEIVNNYEQWLDLSHLTTENFLKFRDVQGFRVESQKWNDYTVIRLYNFELPIGEQIAFQRDNKEAKYDTALLLLYLACRLDESNLERKSYFYDITLKFCKSELFDTKDGQTIFD